MKKLLLLGGSRYLIPVIKKAQELGVYVITCDYLPDNIAHKYSDEYHNVSIVDKEAVLRLSQQLNIDGIMSFATDPGVETAAYVAEKMGLPSCGSYESVRILQNKNLFRQFLKEHGFNVPKSYSYSSFEEMFAESDRFAWPMIVKPVDSAGSKGVTRVDSKNELENAFYNALENSKSNRIIIEEFIEKEGYSSDSDCFSINGTLEFCSFSNQFFDKNAANPYTPAGFSWPSTMKNECKEELRSELQRLISLLNMKTSIYNIETRVGLNGKPYIMEVSPRGGGNRLAEMIELQYGVDLISASIKASLGEQVPKFHMSNSNGHIAEVILHAEKIGVYNGIEVCEDLKKNIIQTDEWKEMGTKINRFTGANESLGTLVLKFEEFNDMQNVMNDIGNYVCVRIK